LPATGTKEEEEEFHTVSNLFVACSILDVNTALVDDGLVDKSKIGGANYYWSFPSKQDCMMQKAHHERINTTLPALRDELETQKVALTNAKRGREDDEEGESSRVVKLQRLANMRAEQATLQTKLETLKENDPLVLANVAQQLALVTQAAHRWTDNIFNCQSYLVKKRGMDKKQVNRILGITDAFDCTLCMGVWLHRRLTFAFADPEDPK